MQEGSPMPFADTGQSEPHDYTNSAGLFFYGGGEVTTTLNGKYVRVNDNCGATEEVGIDGSLDLGGVNGDHDCVSAGDSPGNTSSSRSCFYELNKLIEVARGWLPNNSYLTGQLTANVNINNTCNANYDYTNVNFFKSGGGCRNTGEIAAVFDHEWGHALDDNDAAGEMSSSSEAYADIVAIYRLQTSCVGHGFWHTNDRGCGMTADGTGFNANESQNGVHCDLDCSGVRDADWAKHEAGVPGTPQNFVCGECYSGSGPCGRQVHCSAAPSRQAAWDLVTRDLPGLPYNYDSNTAFIVGSKLFYQGSGNIGSWHACTCPDSSNGCGATNAYMQWLAADDDNGDLQDGTPHMQALYQAFNRHNIACDSPAPVNGGCDSGPAQAPELTLLPGSNQVELQWTSVPGAASYRILRTEGFAGCDFGKAVIANVSGTSHVDPDVANGRPYSYVVQAVGGSDACFSPASACATATPQPCSGTLSLDRGLYNCADQLTIGLTDSDLAGTGTQAVTVESDTEATPETVLLVEQVGSPGTFSGGLATTDAPPTPGDGVLSVQHDDTLTVRYVDASYCGIPDVPVNRPATVDCVAPAIFNVRSQEVTGYGAEILWETDEPADSAVVYDPSVPPAAGLAEDPAAVTEHALQLTGLDECTLYHYVVLSSDPAENSSVDDNAGAFYTFETGKNVSPIYETLDPPLSIPDDDPAGAEMSIVVADDEPVVDVDVQVFITHTYTGDLELSLIGPGGTEVLLSDRHGGSGNDFAGTIFDDDAETAIADGDPPFEGRYRPDGSLAVFNDTLATGSWSLRVEDHAGVDTGTIDSWNLRLTYPAKACGPHLKSEFRTLTDRCLGFGAGAGNHKADPGEDLSLSLVLRNDGTDGTTNVSARLTTTTPGVTITAGWSAFPDLAAGEAAANLFSPFAFTLDDSVACGSRIDFGLETEADEGAWSESFSFIVGGSGIGGNCPPCYVPVPGGVAELGWNGSGKAEIDWTPTVNASFYSLYRGLPADLPALLDQNVDSCKRMSTSSLNTGEVLHEDPAAGSLFWYLVRAGNGAGEGPAGEATAGTRLLDDAGVCP
jgi:subtilisin-like proprotein convertase family protein